MERIVMDYEVIKTILITAAHVRYPEMFAQTFKPMERIVRDNLELGQD
jgi:hypothetical protein